jgi:hypothetical protein
VAQGVGPDSNPSTVKKEGSSVYIFTQKKQTKNLMLANQLFSYCSHSTFYPFASALFSLSHSIKPTSSAQSTETFILFYKIKCSLILE